MIQHTEWCEIAIGFHLDPPCTCGAADKAEIARLRGVLSDAADTLQRRERRTRVQGDGAYWMPRDLWREPQTQVPGSITWAEHLEVWAFYDKKWGCGQSAERIAERGGFGYWECAELLGRPLRTWEPHPQFVGGGTK